MADPILYGPAYSTYTRSVRMTLMERSIPYKLVEVDVMNGEGDSPRTHRVVAMPLPAQRPAPQAVLLAGEDVDHDLDLAAGL